jgi:hypothetical protein
MNESCVFSERLNVYVGKTYHAHLLISQIPHAVTPNDNVSIHDIVDISV